MKALEEKIVKEGRLIGSEILKVDNFLNHQIDTAFCDEMGKEIARLFGDMKPNKILTVESSGIAIACAASRFLGYIPVVFAKKTKPNTLTGDVYAEDCRSFTKGTVNTIIVDKRFLKPEDNVLIVDDFLASGEAGVAMCRLLEQAGCSIAGFTAAVEKRYQGGEDRIASMGVSVKCLAIIEKIENGRIIYGTIA